MSISVIKLCVCVWLSWRRAGPSFHQRYNADCLGTPSRIDVPAEYHAVRFGRSASPPLGRRRRSVTAHHQPTAQGLQVRMTHSKARRASAFDGNIGAGMHIVNHRTEHQGQQVRTRYQEPDRQLMLRSTRTHRPLLAVSAAVVFGQHMSAYHGGILGGW